MDVPTGRIANYKLEEEYENGKMENHCQWLD